MKKCLECGELVIWNSRSDLCKACFDKKVENEKKDDKAVESPHASWF